MKTCLYCAQAIKSHDESLFHRSCRKVFLNKAEKAIARSNDEWPSVVVKAHIGIERVKLCRTCLNVVDDAEIVKSMLLKERLKLFHLRGVCCSCISIYNVSSHITEKEKRDYNESREMSRASREKMMEGRDSHGNV